MILVRRLLGLMIITKILVGGEICGGYCRAKEDCLGSTNPEKGSCPENLICCKQKNKSDEKCKRYERYVYQKKQSLALTARSMTYTASECSIEAVPLVVGGVKAKEKEFPHMVAIGYGANIGTAKWLCGGSLISENYVLSAAHCSKSRSWGPARFARIGTVNLNDLNDSNVQDFTIVNRINHPKYKAPSRYNDIALFKLSRPVKINAYARPACLHIQDNELDFKKAVATGWGKLDYDASEGTPNLMKVTIDLIDYPVCNASYSFDVGGKSLRHGIVNTQLCAGYLKGGKDTCQGDSGGPLQIIKKDYYCMYAILGITSFGKFCGFKNSPAVYTKISYYVPWIESVVWP